MFSYVFVLFSLIFTGCFQGNGSIIESNHSNGDIIESDQDNDSTPESEQIRNGDMIVRATVFPTGTSEETYYFEIDENGLLSSYMGTRRDDDIESNEFLRRIFIKEQKQLSEEEIVDLFAYLDKLQQSDIYSCERWLYITDSWHIALLYNNEKYEINYDEGETDVLRLIIDTIISLSPILVDLRGFA